MKEGGRDEMTDQKSCMKGTIRSERDDSMDGSKKSVKGRLPLLSTIRRQRYAATDITLAFNKSELVLAGFSCTGGALRGM